MVSPTHPRAAVLPCGRLQPEGGVRVPAGSCCPAAAARSGCDGVGDIDLIGRCPTPLPCRYC